MADQRALDAIARIERALARIEAAALSAQSSAKSNAGGGEELERLTGRHEALRGRVANAIVQIDQMLATGAPG